jgi:DNA replication protein DnaC
MALCETMFVPNKKNMKTNYLELIQAQRQNVEPVTLNIGSVFNRGSNSYSGVMLYMYCFNSIPNIISESNIDCVKANEWFTQKYTDQIDQQFTISRCFNGSKTAQLDDAFYLLSDKTLVFFNSAEEEVRILYGTNGGEYARKLADEINTHKTDTHEQTQIYLLVNKATQLGTQAMIVSQRDFNISDNYNEDFASVHQVIAGRLNRNNDKGLVLLHGQPGTGKTSYIRYLASLVSKKMIFMPPAMVSSITNASLLRVLIDNPNSILIIEDAENVIVGRDTNGNSPVSTLLNISDGLLSDCLNIQIICSFNTDLSKVDKALMRKGRLIAKYEFKELTKYKSQKLSDKLGFDTQIKESMTLTSIYNQQEEDYQMSEAKRIGFQTLGKTSI